MLHTTLYVYLDVGVYFQERNKMAKKTAGFVKKDAVEKKTSIGGNHTMIKTSSMNKNKRASYKRYRGQGK